MPLEPRSRILILKSDLFARDGDERAFYRHVIANHPDVAFHFPATGDGGTPGATSELPANAFAFAFAFAFAYAPDLDIGGRIGPDLGDHWFECFLARRLFAVVAAIQGMTFDIADLPPRCRPRTGCARCSPASGSMSTPSRWRCLLMRVPARLGESTLQATGAIRASPAIGMRLTRLRSPQCIGSARQPRRRPIPATASPTALRRARRRAIPRCRRPPLAVLAPPLPRERGVRRAQAEAVASPETSAGRSATAPATVDRLFGDAAKARALIGWTPSTPLHAGLTATVAWWRSRTPALVAASANPQPGQQSRTPLSSK